MARRVGYGIAVVVGLVGAYYVMPLFVAIISLGEICPYSPAGTNICARSSSAPTRVALPGLPTSFEPTEAKLCKRSGIRYTGTTAEGAKVCFTLSPDRSKWVEIGFKFARASACPHDATGEKYYVGSDRLTGPGQIAVAGFTATIRGARASGTLEDSDICGSKTFKWTARRAP
jgi:hypothetical protein